MSIADGAVSRIAACEELGFKLVRRYRLRHHESLVFVAALVLQVLELDRGFDAFCHDGQFQTPGHRYDGLDDRRLVIKSRDLFYEGAVDLEFVEREAVQVTQ